VAAHSHCACKTCIHWGSISQAGNCHAPAAHLPGSCQQRRPGSHAFLAQLLPGLRPRLAHAGADGQLDVPEHRRRSG
jgi:hypothetical protein